MGIGIGEKLFSDFLSINHDFGRIFEKIDAVFELRRQSLLKNKCLRPFKKTSFGHKIRTRQCTTQLKLVDFRLFIFFLGSSITIKPCRHGKENGLLKREGVKMSKKWFIDSPMW